MIKIETITQAATVTLPANDYYQLTQMVIDSEAVIQELMQSISLDVCLDGNYPNVRIPTPKIPELLQQRLINQTVESLLQNPEALRFLVEKKKHYFDPIDGSFDDWDYGDRKVDLMKIDSIRTKWQDLEVDILFEPTDTQDGDIVVDSTAKEEF